RRGRCGRVWDNGRGATLLRGLCPCDRSNAASGQRSPWCTQSCRRRRHAATGEWLIEPDVVCEWRCIAFQRERALVEALREERAVANIGHIGGIVEGAAGVVEELCRRAAVGASDPECGLVYVE